MEVHYQDLNMKRVEVRAEVYMKNNNKFSFLPSNKYLEAYSAMLGECLERTVPRITINGLVDERIWEIATWDSKYGILLSKGPCHAFPNTPRATGNNFNQGRLGRSNPGAPGRTALGIG